MVFAGEIARGYYRKFLVLLPVVQFELIASIELSIILAVLAFSAHPPPCFFRNSF